jgi:transposase
MMKNVFEQALGIKEPWFIDRFSFDVEKRRLDIHIDFPAGTRFEYVSKEEGVDGRYSVHDTKEKTWRHLNFFPA